MVRTFRILAPAVVLAFLLPGAAARTGEVRIAVLVSHKGPAFAETIDGFHRFLVGHGYNPRYVTYQLEGSAVNASRAVEEAGRGKPDLLFTLGSLATETAVREIPDVPIVAGMILRADTIARAANATGVYLEFSPETQFHRLREILPETRVVGVLYNPGENRERILAASKVAESMGLSLLTREVSSPRDLPAALDVLSKRADVLWGMYDLVVLTPETARSILLFSFRHRIPVIGPSASWVKAGALYSLEWDYVDMGSQCGEMADRILGGAPPSSIPPAQPRKANHVLNLNTTRQLKVRVPDAMVGSAAQIFREE